MADQRKTIAAIAIALNKKKHCVRDFMRKHKIRNGFNLEDVNAPRTGPFAVCQTGKNSGSWKGEAASYKSKHKRLYTLFGKPTECSVCYVSDGRIIDYANLTGDYDDPADFRPMCRSCHTRYDKGRFSIEEIRRQKGIEPEGRTQEEAATSAKIDSGGLKTPHAPATQHGAYLPEPASHSEITGSGLSPDFNRFQHDREVSDQ